jgi:hypothetical protein
MQVARLRHGSRRVSRPTAVNLVVVGAAIFAILANPRPAALPPSVANGTTPGQLAGSPASVPAVAAPSWAPPPRGFGRRDGILPDGATIFDDEAAGIANLDPELQDALRRATKAATAEGVTITINSGWRSGAYQDRLLRDAIAEYGSEEEAARWVATRETSPHVSGDAVDIGSSDGSAWLSQRGAEFGLCQIYRNEPWHYELREEATAGRCPRMYADPTQDPRMQR